MQLLAADKLLPVCAEPVPSLWTHDLPLRPTWPPAFPRPPIRSGPIVCIIDTGINVNHPDLLANLHPLKGYNAITRVEGNAVNDDNSHGSHCAGACAWWLPAPVCVANCGVHHTCFATLQLLWWCNGFLPSMQAAQDKGVRVDSIPSLDPTLAGTIGGAGNNGAGVAGVSWSMQMLGCKFLDSAGSGYTSNAVECVRWCRSKGAKITSNSWGGGGYSQALYDEIKLSQVRVRAECGCSQFTPVHVAAR